MTGPEIGGLIAGSLAVGLALGATGIGGFLMVPLFAVLMGLPIQAAVGTALALGILTALPNLWLYARHVGIDHHLAVPLALGAGIASGLLGAVTGAGGPLVSVPLLAALGHPLQKAIGASLCMLLAIGAGAGGSYVSRGLVDSTALAWATPPQAIGIWIGMRWALALHPARLKRLVAGFCCLVALGLMVQVMLGQVR